MTDRQRALVVLFLYFFFFTSLLNLMRSQNNEAQRQQAKQQRQTHIENQDEFPQNEVILNQQKSNNSNYLYSHKNISESVRSKYESIKRLCGIPFKGLWDIQQLQLEQFENINGKILMNIQPYQSQSFKFYFLIYDGFYADSDVNAITLEQNNTLIRVNDQMTSIIYGKQWQKMNQTQMLSNLTIRLNQNIDHISSYSLQPHVTLNAQKYISFSIDFDFNNTNYNRKSFCYSLLMTILATIHFISIVKIATNLVESESEGDKYSLLTIGFISIWDGYLCMLHFYFAINVQNLFQYFLTPSFCYFTLFTVFETRILILIWKSRYFPGSHNLEDLRRNLFKFYIKYYVVMFIIMYIVYEYIFNKWLLIIVNLYMVPQIIHQAMKGQQTRLNHHYIFGLLVSRSILPLYFQGCPYNLFELSPNYSGVILNLILISIQVGFLVGQSYYGTRFFVPSVFLPKQYNYFHQIPDNLDLESQINNKFFDECVICMNPIMQQSSILQDTSTSFLNEHPYLRRINNVKNQVMKTPCEHIFHVQCLVEWMNVKMECPTCRNQLPSLQ